MIPAPADLQYFMEVARVLNMSRAAERLGISQPSLTLAMQRLERAVGATLFNRGKRGVSLTPAGRQLQLQAQILLQQWDAVRTAAQESVHAVRGSYTLGVHSSVALFGVTHVVPALMNEYPGLEIKLRHDLSRKIAEDVISMTADIGVVVNPVAHPDLVIHKLCTDTVSLWRRAGRVTAQTDMAAGTATLICDPELLQSRDLMKKMERKGMRFARTVTSGNLEVITALIARGGGIGILPGQAVPRAPERLEPVKGAPSFTDTHCVVYRMENKSVKAVQAMVGAIRAFYAARA